MHNQLHPSAVLKLDVVADLGFIVVIVVGGGGVIPRKLAALLKEGSDAPARARASGERRSGEGRGPSRAARDPRAEAELGHVGSVELTPFLLVFRDYS